VVSQRATLSFRKRTEHTCKEKVLEFCESHVEEAFDSINGCGVAEEDKKQGDWGVQCKHCCNAEENITCPAMLNRAHVLLLQSSMDVLHTVQYLADRLVSTHAVVGC
jgi:hypothetical protein